MREYKVSNKAIYISFDYDKDILKLVKNVFKDASWNPESKQWSFPNNEFNSTRLDNLIDKYDFTQSEDELEIENVNSIGLPSEGETALIKDIIESGLSLRLTPRPYQFDGVTYMLKHKSCINGDDMGLGKTGQSIIAVETGILFPCLVVTPAGVKYNWEKEWGKWVDGRSVSVIDGKDVSMGTDVVVINFDILNKHLKELSKVEWRSMILDESHNYKNGKAQRTKAVKKLSKKIEYKYLLSGTAIMNRPKELISQLEILGKFDSVFGNWKKFIYKFCDAKNGRFGLDYDGASNTLLLNKILRENCYIRREKSEVAGDIPDILNQSLEIQCTNSREFDRAKRDIVSYKQDVEGDEAAIAASNAETLVLLNTLKRLSIEGKMKGIMEWIDNFLESTNDKLVVFGGNVAPLEELSVKYKCPLVNGSTSSKDKLIAIEKWQTSKDRIIFGNMQSMGTGVDGLQDVCSHMLVIQFPDVPTILDQAVSRLHRTGQTKPVNVYKTFSTNGIDYMMWDVLCAKYEVVEAVNKGKKIDARQLSSMDKELIKKLKI